MAVFSLSSKPRSSKADKISGLEGNVIGTWSAPLAGGGSSEEMLLAFDRARERRVLVIPALFDEANKMRRFTVETMRQLDACGIDSFLPDLPGQNESLQPLQAQSLTVWREAIIEAAQETKATEVLAIRGGALLAPDTLAGTLYSPLSGAKILRAMLRARVIASREAGTEEKSDALAEAGRREGLMLAGWPIGPEMFSELEVAEPTRSDRLGELSQQAFEGPGLWLRAEPGEAPDQSERLAGIIADPQAEFA